MASSSTPTKQKPGRKYPEELTRAAERAKQLTGLRGPVQIQVKRVQETFADPIAAIKQIDMSYKELKAIADGSAGRGKGRALKPLADQIKGGNDWSKGRNLAASLVALHEQQQREARRSKSRKKADAPKAEAPAEEVAA